MGAKPSPALAVRVPEEARRGAEARLGGDSEDPERPRLRLVVTKGRLGVELERSFPLGPLTVTRCALHLPDVRFPVELTGGVDAFRNRRGMLDSLGLSLTTASVREWASRRLRGLLGAGAPEVLVAPVEDGWLVGIAGDEAALGFELLLAPLGGDLRLLPVAARGLGLRAPPLQLALCATEALTKPLGHRRGGLVVVEGAARALSRALLPLAGMRAASSAGLQWSPLGHAMGESSIRASGEAAPALSEPLIRSVELSLLAFEGDEALAAGDLDRARREYLRALARAPRHPALVDRVAEIDGCVGGRAEAALGMISDARAAIDGGPLAARLLQAVGDLDSAREAYRRAAEREPFGALAALCWCELAELSRAPAERLAALDHAVARAPLFDAVRRRRFAARLTAGDLRGARDDAAHLEATARGASERHDVLRSVADRFRDAGHDALAAEIYERALRYVPDSVEAVAGLAQSYQLLGQERRALDLLGRALALAERFGRRAYDVELALAKSLADVADDRPAAIAHVRAVGAFAPESFEARLLEARWRAELGDLAGAAVALGRLAEAVEQAGELLVGRVSKLDPFGELWGPTRPWPRREDAQAAIATMLIEGARLQQELRGDRLAARTLVSLALRLAPRDRTALGLHRQLFAEPVEPPIDGARADPHVSGARAEPAAAAAGEPPGRASDAAVERVGDSEPPLESDGEAAAGPGTFGAGRDPLAFPFGDDSSPSGEDEQLIEQLTDRLRADPTHRQTVLDLAAALERTGRHLDLLALLTARIEEGDADLRAELEPRRRAVLARLRDEAAARGATDDAALYALMLETSTGAE